MIESAIGSVISVRSNGIAMYCVGPTCTTEYSLPLSKLLFKIVAFLPPFNKVSIGALVSNLLFLATAKIKFSSGIASDTGIDLPSAVLNNVPKLL